MGTKQGKHALESSSENKSVYKKCIYYKKNKQREAQF